jgi:hypothetical protein
VIQSSGQAVLACPPFFGRERLVRTHAVEYLINLNRSELKQLRMLLACAIFSISTIVLVLL